jgi:hypothetical protein
MGKYIKKATIVEANQFWNNETVPIGVRINEYGKAYVVTAHYQKVYLEPGDWIVPEPDGEHYYPIKNDIFTKTYICVDETTDDFK